MTTSRMTEQERLAVVETKIDTLIEQQRNITDKIDLLLPTFVTKDELDEYRRENNRNIAEIKKRHVLQTWLVGIMSAAFGSMLTLLIGYFVQSIGG